MKKFFMFVGLPGSGKSTVAAELEEYFSYFTDDVFVYSTDRYIEAIAKAQNKTYNEVFADTIKEATEIMNEYLDCFIESTDGVSSVIIWDQTNLTKKSRASKLDRIPKDYEKEILIVQPLKTVIFSRNKERKKVGRGIPDNVLLSMMESYEPPTNDEAHVRDVTKEF